LPWYSAVFSLQIAFIASMRSRSSVPRRSGSVVPWFAISSRFQPLPTPNSARPFDNTSSDATSLAVWIGSRWITSATPVPSLILLVTLAAAASATNGSSVS
jgi:hypothetical protein